MRIYYVMLHHTTLYIVLQCYSVKRVMFYYLWDPGLHGEAVRSFGCAGFARPLCHPGWSPAKLQRGFRVQGFGFRVGLGKSLNKFSIKGFWTGCLWLLRN